MEKIKVLFYDPSSGFGGSSRCLRDLLQKIDKSRFQPVVAVLDDGPAIKEIKKLGFDVVQLIDKGGSKEPVFSPSLIDGYGNSLRYVLNTVLPLSFKMARLIRKDRIRLVHVNTLIRTGMEAIFAAKMAGVPCVCHLHATIRWTRTERMLSGMVTKYICLTDTAKEMYKQYAREDKLVRVYNGLDMEKRAYKTSIKDIRKEFGIDARCKIVGIVGRITEGKGHEVFLRAAKVFLARRPDTKILVVGDILSEADRGFKDSLISLSGELGIADKVIFTGWREDVMDIIPRMDVMVQASDTFPEGFSLTCIEAMAAGTPLVVTNIAGHSEIVANGETGFIVPPGDAERMAEAILAIIDDKGLSDRFSRKGRERAESLFDLNNTVRQIEDVYIEAVSCSRG